jgi:hypothetical protein
MSVECKDRPNFVQFDSQFEPQRAYLILDETNHLYTDYTGVVGGGVSSDVFNGLTLRWEIDQRLTSTEIENLLIDVKPLVKIILDDSEIDYVNSNRTRKLGERAKKADIELQQYCELHAITENYDQCDDENCRYCYNNL